MSAENKTVLVIDDTQNARAVFEEALKTRGVKVFVFANPEEGVRKAVEIEPDLVFISLIFQDSNGLKVSKAIHSVEKLRKVPVVMLISYMGELDPKYTSTIGIVDVLVKPYAASDIAKKTALVMGEGYLAGMPSEAFAPAFSDNSEHEISLSGEEDPWLEETSGAAFQQEEVKRTFAKDSFAAEEKEENFFAVEEEAPLEEKREWGSSPESFSRSSDEFSPIEDEGKPKEKPLLTPRTEAGKTEDETARFLADEEVPLGKNKEFSPEGLSEEDLNALFGEEEKKSPNKLLLAVAGVLIIAGLGVAVYMNKDLIFPHETKKPVSVAAKKAPLPLPATQPQAPKEPVKEEIKQESKTAPQQQAAAPSTPKPAIEAPQKKEPPPAEKPKEAKKEPKQEPKQPEKKEPAPESKTSAAAEAKAVKKNGKETKHAKSEKGKTYSIQIGVFANEKNAQALAEKMKHKGYDVFVLKDEATDRQRVLVGKFDSNSAAVKEVHDILSKEGMKSVIHRH